MTTNQSSQKDRIRRRLGKTRKVPRLSSRRGTDQTARITRRKIREGAGTPVVLAMRDELVRNLPAHDKAAEARAVFDFVRQAIRYTDDGPGVDTSLGAPFVIREYMEGRRTPADCVTQTILAGALLRSLRIPVRLKVQGEAGPFRSYYHIYPEAKIDGAWQPADITAATAADPALREAAGVGFRAPAGREKVYDLEGVHMLYTDTAGPSARKRARRSLRGTSAVETNPRYPLRRFPGNRPRRTPLELCGLGAEAPPAKEATTQEKVSKKGGSGSWISDAIGIVTGIFGGIGSGSRRRAARTSAQDRLVGQQVNAKGLLESTMQHEGKKLSDQLYGTLMQEVVHIHGNTQAAAVDYFAGGTYGT